MFRKRDYREYDEPELWADVPEVTQECDFIVDEAKDNIFTALVEKKIASYDVAETLYLVGGIWRIVVNDTDDDEDMPSMLLEITVDRRFKVETAREAVIKLLENLYRLEA